MLHVQMMIMTTNDNKNSNNCSSNSSSSSSSNSSNSGSSDDRSSVDTELLQLLSELPSQLKCVSDERADVHDALLLPIYKLLSIGMMTDCVLTFVLFCLL